MKWPFGLVLGRLSGVFQLVRTLALRYCYRTSPKDLSVVGADCTSFTPAATGKHWQSCNTSTPDGIDGTSILGNLYNGVDIKDGILY